MFRVATDPDLRHAILQGDLPPFRLSPYWGFVQRGSSPRWEEEWQETIAWCRDQFGRPGRDRRWFMCRGQLFVCIRSDTDATAFRLRWC